MFDIEFVELRLRLPIMKFLTVPEILFTGNIPELCEYKNSSQTTHWRTTFFRAI